MAVGAQSHDQSLREQLRSLAATVGFTVEGLEFLGDEQTPRALGNDGVGRLRTLLHDYNYVVAYDAESRITEIRVLGLRQPPAKAPEGVAVVATRNRSHHLVGATRANPVAEASRNKIAGSLSAAQRAEADRLVAERWRQAKALSRAPTPSPAAFRVQLGAFLTAENAPAVWRRLRVTQRDLLGGLRQRVQRAELGERVFHLLQVGPLAESEAAKDLCVALTARGVDCLVVKP
jgi:cell division septation protein DedD